MKQLQLYTLQFYKEYHSLKHPSGKGDGPYQRRIEARSLEDAIKGATSEIRRIISDSGFISSSVVTAEILGPRGKRHILYDRGTWYNNGRKKDKS